MLLSLWDLLMCFSFPMLLNDDNIGDRKDFNNYYLVAGVLNLPVPKSHWYSGKRVKRVRGIYHKLRFSNESCPSCLWVWSFFPPWTDHKNASISKVSFDSFQSLHSWNWNARTDKREEKADTNCTYNNDLKCCKEQEHFLNEKCTRTELKLTCFNFTFCYLSCLLPSTLPYC